MISGKMTIYLSILAQLTTWLKIWCQKSGDGEVRWWTEIRWPYLARLIARCGEIVERNSYLSAHYAGRHSHSSGGRTWASWPAHRHRRLRSSGPGCCSSTCSTCCSSDSTPASSPRPQQPSGVFRWASPVHVCRTAWLARTFPAWVPQRLTRSGTTSWPRHCPSERRYCPGTTFCGWHRWSRCRSCTLCLESNTRTLNIY